MSTSEEIEQNEIDADICNETELKKLFDESLRISSEEAISLKKDYILYLDNSRDFDRIAAGTSGKSVYLFDLNNNNGLTQLHKCDIDSINTVDNSSICDIRFGKKDSNSLFIALTNGKIHSYDLRSNSKPVQTFEGVDKQKPFSCFDVNANDTVLCAGTEQYAGEAHIKLFDVRKVKTFATYTDSHRDDLTQVRFHSNRKDIFASGSTDGLINVFCTNETDEDDALQYSLNTGNSIQTINWHPKGSMEVNDDDSEDYLSCITDTNDFQLFDVEESELVFEIEREKITKLIKRKSVGECYLINCYTTLNGEIVLLAGSNFNTGECLRSLTKHKKSFKPRNNFIDNKQIVRCSVYNAKNNILVTAGEGGIVTVWENQQSENSDKNKLKEKVKTKKNRKSKPY